MDLSSHMGVKPRESGMVEFSVIHLSSCRSYPMDIHDSDSGQISYLSVICLSLSGVVPTVVYS